MEKKPSFLINVITGRIVTHGRRHRVLVRDDRGVVVGVAEALDLVHAPLAPAPLSVGARPPRPSPPIVAEAPSS